MRAILGTLTVERLCASMAIFNTAVLSYVFGVGCGTSIASNDYNSNLQKPLFGAVGGVGVARAKRLSRRKLGSRKEAVHPAPMKIKPLRQTARLSATRDGTAQDIRQRGRHLNRAVVSIC